MKVRDSRKNESNLLIAEPPLQVLPTLATKIGLNEAIIIQQLHYWLLKSEHVHDLKKWIYNTYEDWQRQFPFWSIDTIKRIFIGLEKNGLILSEKKFNKIKIDRTKWYSINYEKLEEVAQKKKEKDNEIAIVHNCTTMRASCPDGQGITAPSREGKLPSPITREETTAETTTPTVVAPSAPEKKKDTIIAEIMAVIVGAKLEGMISSCVIQKALQDYQFSTAAHEAYQPETPAKGVLRILKWMIAVSSDIHCAPIPNPPGFLRAMAQGGMDKPPAVIRAEQEAEERRKKEAREKKEKEEAEKIRQEIENNPLTPEERKKIIEENAPGLLEKAEERKKAGASAQSSPAQIGELLGKILTGGTQCVR